MKGKVSIATLSQVLTALLVVVFLCRSSFANASDDVILPHYEEHAERYIDALCDNGATHSTKYLAADYSLLVVSTRNREIFYAYEIYSKDTIYFLWRQDNSSPPYLLNKDEWDDRLRLVAPNLYRNLLVPVNGVFKTITDDCSVLVNPR